MCAMDTDILKQAKRWTEDAFDEATRKEIQTLIDQNNETELTDRFYRELEFGTGGLRGVMGAGSNRMNNYIVGRASQGLAAYIIEKKMAEKGVAIAYDSRLYSDEFAKTTACVMAGNGIKAYLFDTLSTTPILSFTVRHLKTAAGVVVTASHNPKEYNGYKVYWEDGAQITPPHDKNIIATVNRTSFEDIRRVDFQEGVSTGLIKMIGTDVACAYLSEVKKQIINLELCRTEGPKHKIVYTPLHGTGITLIPQALAQMGLTNVIIEPSQEKPDSNFSTVESPNPEDGEALYNAIETAHNAEADLVIGTDPDGDRMGIAVRSGWGEFVLLSGNQIGSILMEAYGVAMEETLTGFKYIGEKMKLYDETGTGGKPSRQFIFGGEESYGYLAGTYARDKDAVVASSLIAELFIYCKSKGKSLLDYLDDIYQKYGYYKESLKTFKMQGKEGSAKIQQIMTDYRSRPPKTIAGLKVLSIWDIQTGMRKNLAEPSETRVTEPELRPSNVLVFTLDGGTKITVRPSGTEPKIKFYFMASKEIAMDFEKEKEAVDSLVERLETDVAERVEAYSE